MAVEPKPSRLLKLAPELRNRIYEYALLEDGDIEVTAALKQPALLRTCSQIRSETLLIWYTENVFSSRVVDCDGTLDVQWSQHCNAPHIAIRETKHIFSGTPSRVNLMAWLKKIHEMQSSIDIPIAQGTSSCDRMARVISAAHAMLPEYVKKPWVEFERAMERWWRVLEAYDDGWKDE